MDNVSPDASSFVPAEGVTASIPDSAESSDDAAPINIDESREWVDVWSKEFGNLKLSIPSVSVKLKAHIGFKGVGVDEASFAVTSRADLSFEKSAEYSDDKELGSFDIGLGAGFKLNLHMYINVQANGEISIDYYVQAVSGLQYTGGEFRTIKSFDHGFEKQEISAGFEVGPKIYQSDDKTVRIIFNSKDVKNSDCQDEVIINWLNNLSIVRKTLSQFSDNGLKTVDYCAVNQFEHYGLSGNPIYINSKYVVEDLKSVKNNKTEILWLYVHEMAHYADGYGSGKIASRVFDSELSAQLECTYALTVNNFKYSNGKTAVEYFAKNTNLSNGVYSDESFLLKLFRIFEEVDPKLRGLKQAFLSDKYKSDMSEYEKLTVFLNEISNAADINIYDFFTNKEIIAVTNKFLIQ
ncbi:MAG: hypothetical protein ACI4RN_01580 [Oscillospiraceae bacterium]